MNTTKAIIFSTALLFLTVPLVFAPTWHFPKPYTLNKGNTWHFGNYWISTTGTTITVTEYFVDNWLNYTCNAGTQQIHNGTKPSTVYFDEVEQTEGSTWSYSDGTVTVTPSGTNVSILWSQLSISQILVSNTQQAAGVFGIVLILGMLTVLFTGKDVKYAIMLAVGAILCLVTVLVLSNLTILGA